MIQHIGYDDHVALLSIGYRGKKEVGLERYGAC